jgi:hypothetical protein
MKKRHAECYLEILQGRQHSEDLAIDGRGILKYIFDG